MSFNLLLYFTGPLQIVYYVSKAFFISFCQEIAEKRKETDLTLTAHSWGQVATKFSGTANLKNNKILKILINWLVPSLHWGCVLEVSGMTIENSI